MLPKIANFLSLSHMSIPIRLVFKSGTFSNRLFQEIPQKVSAPSKTTRHFPDFIGFNSLWWDSYHVRPTGPPPHFLPISLRGFGWRYPWCWAHKRLLWSGSSLSFCPKIKNGPKQQQNCLVNLGGWLSIVTGLRSVRQCRSRSLPVAWELWRFFC